MRYTAAMWLRLMMPDITRARCVLALLSSFSALACSSSAPAVEQAAEVLVAPSCTAGTRAEAGTLTCQAVGTTRVPEGFAPLSGGWGFGPVLPDGACEGATRAALGQRDCVAIDAGTSTFPPAAASVLVRASGDVTGVMIPVVKTLAEAVALARDGDTVAIDDGDYVSCTLPKAVTLVGHGAARTTLRGTDFVFTLNSGKKQQFEALAIAGGDKAAVLVSSRTAVSFNRVYIHGTQSALQVANGATATLTQSVIEGPQTPVRAAPANAIQVSYGGLVTLTDSEVRRFESSLFAQSEPSHLTVVRSVIHDEHVVVGEAEATTAVAAFTGASITLTQSYVESKVGRIAFVGAQLLDGRKDAVSPTNPPASVTVQDSSLVHRDRPREAGSGVDAIDGATFSITNTTLQHACLTAIGASDSSRVTVTTSAILAARSAGGGRTAVIAESGAQLTFTDSVVVESTQSGFLFSGTSTGAFSGFLITGNHEVGRPGTFGLGGTGQAIALSDAAHITLTHGALADNEGVALYVQSGTAEVEHTVITGTRQTKFGAFHGAILANDARVILRDSALKSNGVGMAMTGGRALLENSSVTDHHEALRLDPGVLFRETGELVQEPDNAAFVAAKSLFRRNDATLSVKRVIDE